MINGVRGVQALQLIKKTKLTPQGLLTNKPDSQRINVTGTGVFLYCTHVVKKLDSDCKWCFYYTFCNGPHYAIVPITECDKTMFGPLMNDGFSKQANQFKLTIMKVGNKYQCYVYTVRDVQSGEECCVEYGADFWSYYIANNPCEEELKIKVRDYYFKKSDELLAKAVAEAKRK